jgi:alkylation response protein AidB-like acyl-CoA dehydrogenase
VIVVNDEHLDGFLAEAKDWLSRQQIPVLPEAALERFAVRLRWQRTLHQGGWLGLSWPVVHGGRGLTQLHQVVFTEALALAGAPSPAGTAGLEVIGPTIAAYGTEEQKTRHLPGIISGDEIWCQGFSEPDSGSDLASISTSAVRVDDGFIINGHKVWSTWSHVASWCALVVRTDSTSKHGGISYLLVPLSAPGVTVRPITQLNGDSEFGEILLEDVHVPVDALLGEMNAGWKYTLHTLSSERGNYLLRRTADLSVDLRALERELGSANSWSDYEARVIGELEADLFALRAQGRRTAARLQDAPGRADAKDSLDKLALARFEQKLAGFARDCLGRYSNVTSGSTRSLNSARWVDRYVFSRAASIYGGTAQIQRNIVAERILQLPREAR